MSLNIKKKPKNMMRLFFNLFMAILLISINNNISDAAHKCELSGIYKGVHLPEETWSIGSTYPNVKYDTICGIIAFKNGFLAFQHDSEDQICRLISLENPLNITVVPENFPQLKVSVDSNFLESPITVKEVIMQNDLGDIFLTYVPHPDLSPEVPFLADFSIHAEPWSLKFQFDGKLYQCVTRNPNTEPCKSWDLTTGDTANTGLRHLVESHWTLPTLVQVNGKMWMTGGFSDGILSTQTKHTEFLTQDDEWITGQALPSERSKHAAIALTSTTVFIFGGSPPGQPSYLYDDTDQSFTPKDIIPNSGAFSTSPNAVRIYSKTEGDVIFAPEHNFAYVYKIAAEIWVEKNEWKFPNEYSERFGLQIGTRTYFLGGSDHSGANAEINADEVWEFKDGRWIERCPLPEPGHAYIMAVGRVIDFP